MRLGLKLNSPALYDLCASSTSTRAVAIDFRSECVICCLLARRGGGPGWRGGVAKQEEANHSAIPDAQHNLEMTNQHDNAVPMPDMIKKDDHIYFYDYKRRGGARRYKAVTARVRGAAGWRGKVAGWRGAVAGWRSGVARRGGEKRGS